MNMMSTHPNADRCVRPKRIFLSIFLLLAVSSSITACNSLPHTPTGSVSESTIAVLELAEEADLAYRQGRWLQAAQHYQQLTEQVPSDAYAWFRLGNTQAQQGHYERAIQAYNESLQRNSDQPKPWFNLSTAYLLRAQFALQESLKNLRLEDPARSVVSRRLRQMDALLHDRIEDDLLSTRGY